jgi:hypothetical protein
VIRVDAQAPFDKGRLVAQRRAPKVPAGDLSDPDPFDRVQGLDASLWCGGCSYPREWNRSPVCNGTLSMGVCSLLLLRPEYLGI